VENKVYQVITIPLLKLVFNITMEVSELESCMNNFQSKPWTPSRSCSRPRPGHAANVLSPHLMPIPYTVPICVPFLWRQCILVSNFFPVLEDGTGVQNHGKNCLCWREIESWNLAWSCLKYILKTTCNWTNKELCLSSMPSSMGIISLLQFLYLAAMF
jgi:hypothetical protein